jgi:hypothetical protein
MDPSSGNSSVVDAHYRTPAWLDRSFVLPAGRVPSPRAAPTEPAPGFVRPAGEDVDFVRVVRRTDTCQRAQRTSTVALLVFLLLLAAYVATAVPMLAVGALVAAAVATSAVLVRVVLRTAPVPRRHAGRGAGQGAAQSR